MNLKKCIKYIFLFILGYIGIFTLNNLRNIYYLLSGSQYNLDFITIPMIISLIIYMIYIFVVKKKKNWFTVSWGLLFLFYNICNGVLVSSNIHTFFILFSILMIYSFFLYLKIKNFSFSLILSFCLMIIITMMLGMIGLLKIVKFIIPIIAILIIIYLFKHRNKLNVHENCKNFFAREFFAFTILFIIAIVGGIGRYVHTYDEYSHWAYDAKAVIHYDKLSTSQEIMSKTRRYAPVITCWHYIVAQYSEFSEPNLYIGLAIFISIFIMSTASYVNNKKYLFLTILTTYLSCFIFGGVYGFDTLYADLAFSAVFGTTFISYLKTKENNNKYYDYILALLAIILTLIKPSGCTASFALLFYIMLDFIFNNGHKSIFNKIIEFIKKYYKLILVVLLSFVIWQGYVKVIDKINVDYYNADVRPWTLKSDLSKKMNFEFINNFKDKIVETFDDTLIYGIINVSLYEFIIISTLFWFAIFKLKGKDSKQSKKTISFISTYLVFLILTALSIFVSFSYYEASIIASFGRYLNCIHVGGLFIIIYLIFSNIECKYMNVLAIILFLFLCLSVSFEKSFYFIIDYKDRQKTQEFCQGLTNRFQYVINNTNDDSKIFVLDQQDETGIMAMWYARYYLFPRKVNASSDAITWKVKTDKNEYDLQNWGLNKKTFVDHLKKYKFEYIYFYSNRDDLLEILDEYYVDFSNEKDMSLFKIDFNNKTSMNLEAVYEQ